MHSRTVAAIVAGILLSLPTWHVAQAQDAATPVRITLHPAAVRPALKHSLLPEFMDLMPGNAAVYYGKVKSEQNSFFANRELREKLERWPLAPLEDLRREQARVPFSDYYFEQAALCEDCDWQLPLRREPGAGIMLPEAQESRQFARILASKTRISIAEGDLDVAMKRLRLTYALARHVAAGETMVNGLVGLAICGLASRQTLEFVQQPGAPNLYWSIAELPRPMIDFRAAIEVELSFLTMAHPELRNPAQPGRTDEQWRATLAALQKTFEELTDDPKLRAPVESLFAPSPENAKAAKDKLLEAGWSADELTALTDAQLIVLQAMSQYYDVCNPALDAFYRPYPDALRGLKAAQARLNELVESSPKTIPLAMVHLPPLQSCRTAQVRVEREFAVLQALEALRHYAAEHGKLPTSLSDMNDLTVPNDPVTGLPFQYRLSGAVARLEGAGLRPNDPAPPVYEIALKRGDQ
jgi:hypothetical protein